MSKSLFKLLIFGLMISAVTAPMMAMEENNDPRSAENQNHLFNAQVIDEGDALTAAIQRAIVGDFEPLKRLLSDGTTANQIFYRLLNSSTQFFAGLGLNDQEAFCRELVNFLMGFGFEVNAQESFSLYTPLMQATLAKLPLLAKYLVELGAHLNLQDRLNGFTALMWAVVGGQYELTEYFIERGADIDLSALRENLLSIALGSSSNEIVDLLLKKELAIDGEHLSLAVARDSSDCLEKLLMRGADANAHIEKVGSPILLACLRPTICRVGIILAQRAGNDGCTLEETVASNFDCLQVLLDYKADVNSSGQQGETGLMYLAGFIPEHMKERLEAGGIELGTMNDDCIIPLAELLLIYGANRELKNNEGKTARDIAFECGNEEMVTLLDTYHPWGEGNHCECLKFRAAQAVLAECKHMSEQEVKEVFQAIPDNIRDVVCLIAPREVKEKIGFKPNFEMVKKNNDNSNNE